MIAASTLSKNSLWEIKGRTEIELPVQLVKECGTIPSLPAKMFLPSCNVLEYKQTTHVLVGRVT
jgi:hypothetical protein